MQLRIYSLTHSSSLPSPHHHKTAPLKPARGWRSAVSSHSGVLGGTPAAVTFCNFQQEAELSLGSLTVLPHRNGISTCFRDIAL